MPEQERIQYRVEIVGGPYDGARGMVWNDDGEHPPPERIRVGTCRGDGSCTGSVEYCARRGRGGKHTFYWLIDEALAPARTTVYEKQSDYVERTDFALFEGRAVYVIGGLDLPSERGAVELVGAGSSDRRADVYARVGVALGDAVPGETVPVRLGRA